MFEQNMLLRFYKSLHFLEHHNQSNQNYVGAIMKFDLVSNLYMYIKYKL